MSIQELQKIKGVGPKYAGMLYDAGVTDLATLAGSTPEQLHGIIQSKGGIARYDDWIQQARDLTSGPAAMPAAGEASDQAELQTELKDLVEELNDLAAQLKQIEPHFQPPAYTPQRMKTVLTENLDRFTPETVKSLQESLDGTSIEDFKDIETWKGAWFTINYLIKLEATERSHALAQHLTRLPGVSTLADIKEMLKDTPSEEFLNPETWKGVWFLVNYELRNAASGAKKRILRESDDEEDRGA
jgi:hypothetical protein